MRGTDEPPGSRRGDLRLLRAALAGTGAIILLILLPDLPRALPLEVQLVLRHPLLFVALALPPVWLGVERAARVPPWRWVFQAAARLPSPIGLQPVEGAVARWWQRLAVPDRRTDPAAAWLIGRPLNAILASVCALLLLTWAPHYLTWPIWADTEQFAISAQSWAEGILPYRDLADFDFPGPIYLLYGLGTVFGWNPSVPFYAADLALLMLVGGMLLAWSRRVLGSWIPGLIGLLSWLDYYLDRDFSKVAQRDWQASALVVLGLLALESFPGRIARPLSAFALAAALAYRPQPVLLVPAMVSAIDESSRRAGGAAARPLGATVWWSVFLLASLLIAFGPLLAAGIFDDFLRALSITRFGGSYNPSNWYAIYCRSEVLFWNDWRLTGCTAALALLAAAGPEDLRRPSRTWMLGLVGAACYKFISPVQHGYLDDPIRLFQSVALAPLAAWLLTGPRLTPSTRLAGLLAVLAIAIPGWPRYCTARGSLEALGPLARGEIPKKVPPGCRNFYPRIGSDDRWDDYRQVLLFLRNDVDRGRPVASLLRSLPIPAINGPSGHLSPFPAAGGCTHLLLVDPSLQDQYVEVLKRTPGTVVVWIPEDPALIAALKFPRLETVVRCWYVRCRQFGPIQVWVRLDEPQCATGPIGSGRGP